jgi:hypothetical protein
MFSEMKTQERLKARRLRREEGRSVKEIERLLGVSRSTASLWVRDIPLTVAQRASLKRRNPIYNGQFKGAAVNAERGRTRRLVYQEQGRRRAMDADDLYVAGCMLYWAEGDKGRNAVRLANSDPAVIRHFAEFLRVEFGVADEQFRITCNLFADHEGRQKEIEDFWLATLGLGTRMPLQVSRQPLFQVQQEEAEKQASLRHVPRNGSQHGDRADDLRLDSGTCRVRSSRVGRPLLARLIRQRLQCRRGRFECA